jgi:hypothetical protein
VLVPAMARAQLSGGIAGVARDTSGSVLPGVTVEAASDYTPRSDPAGLSHLQNSTSMADPRNDLWTIDNVRWPSELGLLGVEEPSMHRTIYRTARLGALWRRPNQRIRSFVRVI